MPAFQGPQNVQLQLVRLWRRLHHCGNSLDCLPETDRPAGVTIVSPIGLVPRNLSPTSSLSPAPCNPRYRLAEAIKSFQLTKSLSARVPKDVAKCRRRAVAGVAVW